MLRLLITGIINFIWKYLKKKYIYAFDYDYPDNHEYPEILDSTQCEYITGDLGKMSDGNFEILYDHNQKAYNNAVKMLARKGRAAVIHPTGTGKSFIGFKLCADHEAENVCWLSPSEYIFNTQIENLKEVTEGNVPDNIFFCTYARLSNMTSEDMEKIAPDYIILDEFHRCGAEVWGLGIYRLLSIYDKVPVLGLSATAVRYLDNQRDISFDGNSKGKV